MRFKDNLNCLLKEKSLKQVDLCRLTGIQTSLMSKYISGKKSPTIKNAVLIADSLHISLDELVGKIPHVVRDLTPEEKARDELYQITQNLSVDEIYYIIDNINALHKFLESDK